jgi:hypothetical protein
MNSGKDDVFEEAMTLLLGLLCIIGIIVILSALGGSQWG